MAVENARENKTGDRFEQLQARRFLRVARRVGDHEIGGAAIGFIEPGLFYQHGEMKTDRYVDFFSERPEGLPGGVVNRRNRARSENIHVPHSAAFGETF